MKRITGLLLLSLVLAALLLPAAAFAYDFPRSHACPVCGEPSNIIDGEEPTCTKNGWASYRCYRTDNCQVFRVTLKKLGHKWVETGSRDATCTRNGYTDYRCTRCGETKRDTVEALGHKWNDWRIVRYKTCTTDGLRVRTCRRCGERDEEVIRASHEWSKWQVLVEPTCETSGLKTHTCYACGTTRDAEI